MGVCNACEVPERPLHVLTNFCLTGGPYSKVDFLSLAIAFDLYHTLKHYHVTELELLFANRGTRLSQHTARDCATDFCESRYTSDCDCATDGQGCRPCFMRGAMRQTELAYRGM